MTKKKFSFSTIFFFGILIVGIGIMLYPTLSNFWNSLHQSNAIAAYNSMVEEIDKVDKEALFKDAENYNNALHDLETPLLDYKRISDQYKSVLNLAGNGIMGYITIDKIGAQLPIYHGTDKAILNVGVGHLEGSSLPIGGESTHAVLTAHRGLPSAKLFTDLDQMEVGDNFAVTILGEDFWYEVDQILIVDPVADQPMMIVDGMDYLTLQTCTPYGINSHRLLVRGHRTTLKEMEGTSHSEAVQIPVYISAFAVMVPMLLVTLIVLILIYHFKPATVSLEDLQAMSRERKKKGESSEYDADEKLKKI